METGEERVMKENRGIKKERNTENMLLALDFDLFFILIKTPSPT